jgi:hypothetical protein
MDPNKMEPMVSDLKKFKEMAIKVLRERAKPKVRFQFETNLANHTVGKKGVKAPAGDPPPHCLQSRNRGPQKKYHPTPGEDCMNSLFFMYLPIAGNSVNILSVMGLGGAVGLLSGIFGVGGGFLMTPLLIMMGIPPTVAAASDSNQIVGASTSGTLAHFRLGNVDIKMGLLLLGGVVGGTLGVQLIKILRQMGNADFMISITYVLMLGFVGGYMFLESLQSMRKTKATKPAPKRESRYARLIGSLPWQMEFRRSGIRMSVTMPLVLGTITR